MLDRCLRIRNFERFQHYKDRRPPWIKLYRDLWSDPRFFELNETERYFLISFFMIASQNDNKVPANQGWLKREMATSRAIPIDRLLQAGWLEWCEQDASKDASADASKMLVLARSRETETEIQNTDPPIVPQPVLELGEFRRVRVTADQREKLKARLDGNFDNYVARFDRWVNEAPDAKAHGVRRRDRHAYESILNWFDRDVKEGKVKVKRPMADKPEYVG